MRVNISVSHGIDPHSYQVTSSSQMWVGGVRLGGYLPDVAFGPDLDPQRGDLASGEGLESVNEGGESASFFEDDDVLLSEMREDAERKAHAKSAGARAGPPSWPLRPEETLVGINGCWWFPFLAAFSTAVHCPLAWWLLSL